MPRSLSARRIASGALLMTLGMVVALGLSEIALRASGFSYQNFPTVQFGWPDPTTIQDLYTPDRDLFWVTHDYQERISGARITHPAIVFMGDSCTQFGSYPRRTLDRLAVRAPAISSGLNLGIGGWSSEQGVAQFRRDVLPLHPKVVTLYYGWNDHWVAMGSPDAEARPGRLAWWLAQHSRLMQVVSKARLGAAVALGGQPNRVDVDRYVMNLETMVRLADGAGIKAVLITAPSNHVRGQEPEYLKLRHVRRLEDLVPLHERYVEATRRSAGETGAVLCDAFSAFKTLPPPQGQYFHSDGIHLTDPGDRAMAELLTDCIVRAVATR